MRSFGVFIIIIVTVFSTLVLLEALVGCIDPYGGEPTPCLILPNP